MWAIAINNLGKVLYMQGKYEEAKALFYEALEMRQKFLWRRASRGNNYYG